MTMAFSRSPPASVSAFLQSIIGAPVVSRSSFTCVAEIFTVDVLIKFPSLAFWSFLQTSSLTKFYPRQECARGSDASGAKAPSCFSLTARLKSCPSRSCFSLRFCCHLKSNARAVRCCQRLTANDQLQRLVLNFRRFRSCSIGISRCCLLPRPWPKDLFHAD